MYMVDGILNLRPIESIISFYMDKINFLIYYLKKLILKFFRLF